MYKIFIIVLALFLSGCGDGALIIKLIEEKDQLEQTNKKLNDELAQRHQRLNLANETIENLRGLPDDRLEQIVVADSIRLGRYTSGYDNDGDGIDDGVNIYLEILDKTGDRIKAYGLVELELWDLSAEPGGNLILRVNYDIEEVGKYWISSLLNRSFKFYLEWPGLPKNRNITIKCSFVDALTGKSFQAQRMIEVKL